MKIISRSSPKVRNLSDVDFSKEAWYQEAIHGIYYLPTVQGLFQHHFPAVEAGYHICRRPECHMNIEFVYGIGSLL